MNRKDAPQIAPSRVNSKGVSQLSRRRVSGRTGMLAAEDSVPWDMVVWYGL